MMCGDPLAGAEPEPVAKLDIVSQMGKHRFHRIVIVGRHVQANLLIEHAFRNSTDASRDDVQAKVSRLVHGRRDTPPCR
jgi:hypothetical protein